MGISPVIPQRRILFASLNFFSRTSGKKPGNIAGITLPSTLISRIFYLLLRVSRPGLVSDAVPVDGTPPEQAGSSVGNHIFSYIQIT